MGLAALDGSHTGRRHNDVCRVVRQAGRRAVQARLEVLRRTEPDPEAPSGETKRLTLLERALVEVPARPRAEVHVEPAAAVCGGQEKLRRP